MHRHSGQIHAIPADSARRMRALSPAIPRNSDDFPEPDAPSSPTISPGATARFVVDCGGRMPPAPYRTTTPSARAARLPRSPRRSPAPPTGSPRQRIRGRTTSASSMTVAVSARRDDRRREGRAEARLARPPDEPEDHHRQRRPVEPLRGTRSPEFPERRGHRNPAAMPRPPARKGQVDLCEHPRRRAPSVAAASASAIARTTGSIERTTSGSATTACAMGTSTIDERRSSGGRLSVMREAEPVRHGRHPSGSMNTASRARSPRRATGVRGRRLTTRVTNTRGRARSASLRAPPPPSSVCRSTPAPVAPVRAWSSARGCGLSFRRRAATGRPG